MYRKFLLNCLVKCLVKHKKLHANTMVENTANVINKQYRIPMSVELIVIIILLQVSDNSVKHSQINQRFLSVWYRDSQIF